MARKFHTNIDANNNELQNAKIHLLASDPGSPADGLVWINTTTWVLKARLNGATIQFGRLDQMSAPTAAVSMNSQRITSLATPSAGTDATTKDYVDSLITGLELRDEVRVAAKTNITVASPGASIDGVALSAGDRVLLTAQSTGSQNGIYVWNGAATPMTRATDFDTAGEMERGALIPVVEGSSGSLGLWLHTTAGAITVGTTTLTFSFIGPTSAGLQKYSTSTHASSTSIAVTHSLGTTAVQAEAYDNSTGVRIEPDITITDANTVTFGFSVAPTANSIRFVVIG